MLHATPHASEESSLYTEHLHTQDNIFEDDEIDFDSGHLHESFSPWQRVLKINAPFLDSIILIHRIRLRLSAPEAGVVYNMCGLETIVPAAGLQIADQVDTVRLQFEAAC